MEPKYFNLFSCIFLLFLLNNPFLVFTHTQANLPNNHSHTIIKPSSLDYINDLVGARKGNSARGLTQLKKYLSNLGYMSINYSTKPVHEIDDFFDDNLELAIKSYQTFFKLNVTGILDRNTISKLSQTRCGVPDNFSHPNKTREMMMKDGVPIIASHYTFFPGEPTWPKGLLTYSFPSDIGFISESILDATNIWASVSPLKFTYIPDYDHADIKISFQYREHGDGSPFDGPLGILAHASGPREGVLHFDGDERWVDGVVKIAFDLQTVGLHELGHVLGLGHTPDKGAVMYPYIGSDIRKGLGQDDINGIRALYPS